MGFGTADEGGEGLDLYLEEVGRHSVLARAEERRLARRARAGDRAALDRLVTANLRFVVAVAKRYRGLGVPFEDLINEGNVGLIRAAERFDADRGVRFVTYAVWWIRQSILAAISAAGDAVPPPVPTGRPGDGGRASSGAARLLSLDAGDPRVEGEPLRARVPDPSGAAPDGAVQAGALRRTLEEGLAFLPEREERVLRLYYGLDGVAARSLGDIGREMGVSRERVRQLRSRALQRLRRGPHARSLAGFVAGAGTGFSVDGAGVRG